MALLTKPNMQQIWASGGDIVEPSDLKKQQGWTVEVPPHQFENWIQNRQDEYLAHINQRGIPQWDGNTEYEAAGLSYVQGSNGVVYKSVTASGPATTVQDPTTDVTDTYWTVAFASTAQASETVQGIVELATTAEAQTGTDDVRAMTALKVKQAIAQFGSDFINTTRINVASSANINLTSSAPNTRHISITGTTTITGFTVAIGQCYFVSFSGNLTLTNNSNIVTNTGANISVSTGDSCIIRATSVDTVEVICGKFLSEAAVGTRGQTWQDFTASRTPATTYTNTTGRPIEIIVTLVHPGALATTTGTLSVGGIVVYNYGSTGLASAVTRWTCTATVPNGATYGLSALSGMNIDSWVELR